MFFNELVFTFWSGGIKIQTNCSFYRSCIFNGFLSSIQSATLISSFGLPLTPRMPPMTQSSFWLSGQGVKRQHVLWLAWNRSQGANCPAYPCFCAFGELPRSENTWLPCAFPYTQYQWSVFLDSKFYKICKTSESLGFPPFHPAWLKLASRYESYRRGTTEMDTCRQHECITPFSKANCSKKAQDSLSCKNIKMLRDHSFSNEKKKNKQSVICSKTSHYKTKKNQTHMTKGQPILRRTKHAVSS